MISSFLQLMGFGLAKPVHSRASENSARQPAKPSIEGITTERVAGAHPSGESTNPAHAQAQSARRTDVKSKVSKAPVATPSKSKAVKAPAAAAPAKKTPVKTVAKVVAKSAPKPATKAQAKPAPKGAVKVIVKPTAKSSHPLAKSAAPSKAPANKIPAVKAVEVTKNQKPTPKSATKPVNEIVKKATPPAAAKSVTKPVAKPATKPANNAPVKAVSKPAPAPVVAPAPAPVAVAPVAVSPSPVPAKAGRPSSRLAQLTVPSMAQSVASTAAKSSYTQTTALPQIVPPLPSSAKKDPKLANNWKTKPVEQMTDADLLAMPDSEYMNEVQMAVFRLKLSVLKQDILNSAGETTEHLREDTVVVPDPADRATIEEEHALELRTRDRERKLLKKIEQSINRIDAGDYGYCDETGEPIGVGRLLARPTATLSLEAQQRRELKQKMFGD